MKVIVAGSRNIVDKTEIFYILNELRALWLTFSEVVYGGAVGVDTIGAEWARTQNIPTKKFQYGKVAGPMRNKKMAEYADACIVIYDGKSRGSKNMIRHAITQNLPLFVFTIDENVQNPSPIP